MVEIGWFEGFLKDQGRRYLPKRCEMNSVLVLLRLFEFFQLWPQNLILSAGAKLAAAFHPVALT